MQIATPRIPIATRKIQIVTPWIYKVKSRIQITPRIQIAAPKNQIITPSIQKV